MRVILLIKKRKGGHAGKKITCIYVKPAVRRGK